MRKLFSRSAFYLIILTWSMLTAAQAHISLVSPPPLMDGHGMENKSLKFAPFGAPGVDVAAAPATVVKSGSEIDLDVSVYIIHPGSIVVLYTRDFEGKDVEPVLKLPSLRTPIPHTNLLHQAASPCEPVTGCTPKLSDMHFKARVKLPDIEGDILLVVRQVMWDKVRVDADSGEVDLSRVYYHQAAKLKLVK